MSHSVRFRTRKSFEKSSCHLKLRPWPPRWPSRFSRLHFLHSQWGCLSNYCVGKHNESPLCFSPLHTMKNSIWLTSSSSLPHRTLQQTRLLTSSTQRAKMQQLHQMTPVPFTSTSLQPELPCTAVRVRGNPSS